MQDGDPVGKKVLIVDDLVQTGGTLYEAGKVIKRMGAAEVYAYVTHGVFPGDSWQRFVDHDEDILEAPEDSTTSTSTSTSEVKVEVAPGESDSSIVARPVLLRSESPCIASRLFKKFWITNSIPQTAYRIPTENSVFEIIDLLPQIIADLEFRHS